MLQGRKFSRIGGKADWFIAISLLGIGIVLIVVLLATRSSPTPESTQVAVEPSESVDIPEPRSAIERQPSMSMEEIVQTLPSSMTKDSSGTIFGEIGSSVLNGPLPDATVTLWKFVFPVGGTSLVEAPERNRVAEVTTDSEGRYTLDFETTVPDGNQASMELTITAPGHARVTGNIHNLGGVDRMEVNTTLDKGQSLAGRVTLVDGSGIEGVDINNQASQAQVSMHGMYRGYVNFQASSHATTDDRGHFVLEGAHLDAPHEVGIRHGRTMYRKQFPEDSDFLEIILPTGDSSIHATVKNHEGHPMVGMIVSLTGRELHGEEFEGLQMSGNAVDTDAHGTCQFKELPAGTYRISARSGSSTQFGSQLSASRQVELEAGEHKEVVIKLEEPYTITGRVLDDETERPIPGAGVSLTPLPPMNLPSAQQALMDQSVVYSDGNGEFTITGQMQSGFLANMLFIRPPEGYILNPSVPSDLQEIISGHCFPWGFFMDEKEGFSHEKAHQSRQSYSRSGRKIV